MQPQIYLYTGPEFGMRDDAVKAVQKSLKKEFGDFEEHIYYLGDASLGQVLSVLDNGNLFSSATCVICKNAELLKKKDEIQLLEDWCKNSQDSDQASSVLIFVSDEINVDAKLDKLVPASNKKKFWEMFDNQKIPWLKDYFSKNGYGLTDDAAQMILDMVDNNTMALKNECSRFFLCLEKGKNLTPEDIDAFLTHNRKENAFSLFKQMIDSYSTEAERLENSLDSLMGIMLSKENSSVALIASLSSCFRQLLLWHKLQAESNGGYGADDATLKANGFKSSPIQAQYRKAAKIWTIGQTTAILAILSSTDMQIRSNTSIDENLLLQKMLYEIIIKKGGSLATAEYE